MRKGIMTVIFFIFAFALFVISASISSASTSQQLVDIGNAFTDAHRYQEALDAYNKALELDPNNANAWRGKGLALRNLERFQEAVDALNKATDIDPDYLDAWIHKGWALDSSGKKHEAVEVFQLVINISERLAATDPTGNIWKKKGDNPWHYEGEALNFLGDNEKSLIAFDKATSVSPENPYSWNGKGQSLFALGKFQEAIDAYDRAIQIKSNDAGFWQNKGNALKALGRYQEANAAYDKAYELTTFASSSDAISSGNLFLDGLKYFSVMGIISLFIIVIILSFEKREKNKPKFRDDLKTRHRRGYYLTVTGLFILCAIFMFISSLVAFKELPIIFDYNKFIFAIPMLYLSVSSFIIAIGLLTLKPNTKLNKIHLFVSLICGISLFAALGDPKTPLFLPFLPLISAGLSFGYDGIAIFKPVYNRELSYEKETAIVSIPVTNTETPTSSLSGKVDAKTVFGYKGATIIYKVKILNDTFDPISDIKVYPYVPDVFLLKDKEKQISLIEPKKSQTATFEIRPTGECGDCNVSGRINYYNTALRKRQDIELETKSLSIVCPILHRKEISEEAWGEVVSELVKAEEATKDIPIESEGLFKIISEILKDMNLFALSPMTNKNQQIFRGTARFYGEGVKGLQYAAAIEVIGGVKKSKVILKAWAEKEDSLTGFYHGLLDSINTRIGVKEYIDEPINNYYIHIGHNVGPMGKVIDTGDKKIDASGLKEALSEIGHIVGSEGKVIDIGDKAINTERGNFKENTLESTNIRKCQSCGKEVQANEKFCLSCGMRL